MVDYDRAVSPSRSVNLPQDGGAEDTICRIVRGEIDAAIVLRTDRLLAFLDHRPVFKGHVLVCPAYHVETLLELPADGVSELFVLTQQIAACLPGAVGAQGTFVAINTVVSQSVPHLHVHVVPRRKGDGLRGFFWPRIQYAEGEAQEYAERIARALNGAGPA
jgi:histidine triad (HIT) family protein